MLGSTRRFCFDNLWRHTGPPLAQVFAFYRTSDIVYKGDLSMWITLAAAAETFASFWEMRLGYSNLALVASSLLLTSQAQCPGYTSYSQVNLSSNIVYLI